MKYHIDVQNVCGNPHVPDRFSLQRWVNAALENHMDSAEVCLRFVEIDEIHGLNRQYRHKDKPTNVLSFPFEIPEEIQMDPPLLGDIVICADIIEKEAEEQQKELIAHWAHMVIHGVLHLLGYDHIEDAEAEIMESMEIKLLADLDYPNPYIENSVND